jgi:hypothetical protein
MVNIHKVLIGADWKARSLADFSKLPADLAAVQVVTQKDTELI